MEFKIFYMTASDFKRNFSQKIVFSLSVLMFKKLSATQISINWQRPPVDVVIMTGAREEVR